MRRALRTHLQSLTHLPCQTGDVLGSAKNRGSQWWKCTELKRPSAFAQPVFLYAIAQGLAGGAKRPRRRHDIMSMTLERGLDDVPVHVLQGHRAVQRQMNQSLPRWAGDATAWP